MNPLIVIALCLCLFTLCACGQMKPEETSTTQPIEYPASYRDAPEAYKPVLDDLYALNALYDIDHGFTGASGFHYAEAIVGAWLYGPIAHYAVVDINNDAVPELLIYQETADGMCLRSVFTLKDGEPFCVESFPARSRHFAADGTMYYVRAVEQECELYSSKLEAGATQFTILTVYYNYRGNCSRVFNGDWDVAEAITEEEFNAALEMHENPSNPMPLTFIPIEQ